MPHPDRILAYGRLGSYLLNQAQSQSLINLHSFINLPFSLQLAQIHSLCLKPSRSLGVVLAAVSLLYAQFPVQVPLHDDTIIDLMLNSFPSPDPFTLPKLAGDNMTYARVGGIPFLEKYFPFKTHPAARNKTNVRLLELLRSLNSNHLYANFMPMLSALSGRLSDDQASSAILYALGLLPSMGNMSYAVATNCILYPADAKGLSTALKALGANSSLLGARLVETDTLQGRGVKPIDQLEEAKYRCDRSSVDSKVLDVNQDMLAEAIRDILNEELLDKTVSFEELDDFWDRRWLWCVNGSHSKVLDRNGGLNTSLLFPSVDRVYRRMYAEASVDEPISSWDGTVYVSCSSKLEHGKTRALFACDTRSYFAFEHLLKPIEKKWIGRRVLLDPGKMGHIGVAARVRSLHGGGCGGR